MIFLCYQAFCLLATTNSIFGNALMPYIIKFSLFWTLLACVVSIIVMLAMSHPKQSAHSLFGEFINETGWKSNAIAGMTGLITPAFGYAAIDASIHYSEEVKDPERNIPRSLLAVLCIGFVSGLAYILALFFSVPDIASTFSTPSGFPLAEMYKQACGETGGIALTILIFFATVPALLDCQVATARLLWALARDDALPFTNILKRVNKKTQVPVEASVVVGISIALLGCIYIGNTTAFNAFIASGLVLNNLTYATPVVINMLQGRKNFRRGKFSLHGATGWIVNGLMVVWTLFTVIFFEFPSAMPVTAANMNYTCLLLGACLIFTFVWWSWRGHKIYHGPTVERVLEGIEDRPLDK